MITPKYAVRQSQAQPAPQVSQNLKTEKPEKSEKSQEDRPDNKSPENCNKDAVRNFIWPWMQTPKGSALVPSKNESGSGIISETKELKCEFKVFNFSNPSQDLINTGQPLDVLYPGSFVQGKYVDSGEELLVKLPISPEYRYPVRVAGNGNFAPKWAASSEAGDVHRTIKEAIWNSQAFYSNDVYVKLVTSSEITSLLTTVNFNEKVTRALGIEEGFVGDWKTKKNKLFITLLQGFASFSVDKMVSDCSKTNDAVSVFLKSTFTMAQAQPLQSRGDWCDVNIPLYVSQATYGRMVAISVE